MESKLCHCTLYRRDISCLLGIYIQRIGHICPAWWIYIYITLGIYALQIAYICLVKTKSMLVNQG